MSRYATEGAILDAAHLGLIVNQADFRDVMLAITDAVLGKGDVAVFVGPTRTAERWSVKLSGASVEVIYEPAAAMVVRVERPRPGMAPVASTGPRKPLVGAMA